MPEPLEDRIRQLFRQHPEVVGAYLFGSRARGQNTEGSDLDLAVLFDGPTDLERSVRLEDELEQALGTRVDLIDLARAGPFLALDAIRGERIYERDGRRLDELDLYILRRAGDLAPFERKRRRVLLGTGGS